MQTDVDSRMLTAINTVSTADVERLLLLYGSDYISDRKLNTWLTVAKNKKCTMEASLSKTIPLHVIWTFVGTAACLLASLGASTACTYSHNSCNASNVWLEAECHGNGCIAVGNLSSAAFGMFALGVIQFCSHLILLEIQPEAKIYRALKKFKKNKGVELRDLEVEDGNSL